MDGRHLIDIFITLPSKKDYPDYYQVITDPIDMQIIEQNIRDGKVGTIDVFMYLFEECNQSGS